MSERALNRKLASVPSRAVYKKPPTERQLLQAIMTRLDRIEEAQAAFFAKYGPLEGLDPAEGKKLLQAYVKGDADEIVAFLERKKTEGMTDDQAWNKAVELMEKAGK